MTLDGQRARLDPQQSANAALIVAQTSARGLPVRAATIAVATAMQESSLYNLDYGDRDSLGLFQQRPSQGWGTEEQVTDPVYATDAFLEALVTVEGYADMALTEAAQAVQRSAFPDAYAKHEAAATLFATALAGQAPAALACHNLPNEATAPTTAQLAEALQRDFGVGYEVAGDGWLDVTASAPDGDSNTAAWQLGSWAVATAATTGVIAVQVGDQQWDATSGNWNRVDGVPVANLGHVRLRLAS